MPTIIDKAQNWYQVWDTNGLAGSSTDTEIITSLSGYGIECQGKQYAPTWFHRQDTYDCLLPYCVGAARAAQPEDATWRRVMAHNVRHLMRKLFETGKPREFAAA